MSKANRLKADNKVSVAEKRRELYEKSLAPDFILAKRLMVTKGSDGIWGYYHALALRTM